MKYIYPATLIEDKDDGGYVVTFRDITEIVTQGDNVKDALFNAADALEEAFALYIDDGLTIPTPSKAKKGEHNVTLSILMAFKAAIYQFSNKNNVSKSELARRLDVDEKEARRIMDPYYQTKLIRLEAALKAVGGEPRLEVRAA